MKANCQANGMTHLKMRIEMDNQVTVEFTPIQVEPLSYADLQAVDQRGENAPMRWHADDVTIDGVPQPGRVPVTVPTSLAKRPRPFALVPGGWLPMVFAIPPLFLVDRNVVNTLRQIREQRSRPGDEAFAFWTGFFQRGSATFNPLLYAFEGASRRTPTFDQFAQAYDEASREIQCALPGTHVIELDEWGLRVGFGELVKIFDRTEEQAEFLLAVAPLVEHKVAKGGERPVLEAVLLAAQRHGLQPFSLPVVVTLSALYDAPHAPDVGRAVLKPAKLKSPGDAYNALADLRNLQLASLAQVMFAQRRFAYCTNDIGVARLWCASNLRAEVEGNAATHTVTLSAELLPRLDEAGFADLREMLRRLA